MEGRAPQRKVEQTPAAPKPAAEQSLASNPAEEEFFKGTVASRAAEAREKAQKAKDEAQAKKIEEEFFGPSGLEGKKKAA
ncbi:MAG: hypothetical protein AAB558_04985 [Patescibacteria group bacterium]